MPQELCDALKGAHADSHDIEDFIDKVSEVSRLIDGLKAGTISPDYVDTKLLEKANEKASKTGQDKQLIDSVNQQQDVAEDVAARAAADQAELQRKVAELKANRERKRRVRQLYQQHTEKPEQKFATDYTKWDLFCPSDEEDDLFNSVTPSNPQFRAMEKDINDRHNRMVEQRQVAERQRQLGNEAFKAHQYSEALRCYELGLDSQKHSMALHANAAMAALKLKCYVQAMEHCDKVLHLAEVLYDTPTHMLCVKALQRRATAYQALGQHNKAVGDLKKAAEILPGDKEVSDQLERAERLQQEHKTAKKLKGLTADAKVAAVQVDAANALIGCLQEMEQLVATLASLQDHNPPRTGVDVAGACRKLAGMVQQEDSFALYFRECGGLAAAIKQVLQNSSPEVLSAALQLLASACSNSTTLEQLAQQQQLLATVLDQLSSSNPAVCAAAIELLYTASTAAVVRQELCKQLLTNHHLPTGDNATSGLDALWASCAATETLSAGVQGLAISLLSNCLLVSTVREASQHLLSSNAARLDDLISFLVTTSSSTEAVKSALPQKLYGLLSNLSSHPATRRRLADHTQLIAAVKKAALGHVATATTPTSSNNCRSAAMGLLCNLSLEGSMQQQLAADCWVVDALLALSCGSFEASSAASDRPTKAGPQLPVRKQKRTQQQMSQFVSAEAAEAQMVQLLLLQERAACLLSRAAKQASGIKALQDKDALFQLVTAIEKYLQQPLRTIGHVEQQGQAQQDGNNCIITNTAWLEAMLRTVALLTAQPGNGSSCGDLQATAAVRVFLALLRLPEEVGKSTNGNAALVLGHFAGEKQWHDQLHRADAVKVLVDVAYAGKGNASSKNAAIALAKMAKDGRMLDRLRELHGLEIIHQYVRV